MTDHNRRMEVFPRLKNTLSEASINTNQVLLYALAGLVAFCTIAYELVYSEQLTVIFGGTVLRYSITIGLFLFSFGIGSFLYSWLDGGPRTFFRVEVGLALAGPVGLIYILVINAFPETPLLGGQVGMVLSHFPIIIVGLLSGLEVPLLTEMNETLLEGNDEGDAEDDDEDAEGEPDDEVNTSVSSYSKILGMDYIGSLFGTVVYALVLYPRFGLIPTVFVLGLFNIGAALAFGTRFGFGPNVRLRNILVVFCLILGVLYGGAVVYDEQVESSLTDFYLDNQIEADWPSGTMDVTIVDHFTTAYQNVVLYDRTWTGSPNMASAPSGEERCLRLDMAIQLCESWTRSYHSGLVDVPAALFWSSDGSASSSVEMSEGGSTGTGARTANITTATTPARQNASTSPSNASPPVLTNNSSRLSSLGNNSNVLLIGGGDWIAPSHLCQYGASVDQVDLDAEFMNYTRSHPYYQQYRNGSPGCEQVNTIHGDGYSYLRQSEEKYDMVILDLPGIRNDDLLKLYSKQFYTLLSEDLTRDGVVVTWGYNRERFPTHYKSYMNTVQAGGFDEYVTYDAYTDRDEDGDQDFVQQYYIFSQNRSGKLGLGNGTDYVERHRQQYSGLEWRSVPTFRGVEVNSVFDPNYDILVS